METSLWSSEEIIDMVVSDNISIDYREPVEIEISCETEGIEWSRSAIYVLKSINKNMESFETSLSFMRVPRMIGADFNVMKVKSS